MPSLLLMVVAIAVGSIGAVRLAVWILGVVRRNRGEVSTTLSTGLFGDWLGDAIDGWVSDEAGHSDADHPDGDHHGDHHDPG